MMVLCRVYTAVGSAEETDDQRRSSGQAWKTDGRDSKRLEDGLH